MNESVDRPLHIHFDTFELRVAGVGDVGQAVFAQERELEVIPVAFEDGAVETQAIVRPLGLPADLIVGQEVRLVGRESAATVDAAGTESFGPRGIEHRVVGGVERGVEAERGVVLLHGLVEVVAGRGFEDLAGVEAGNFAGAELIRIGGAKAEESLQRILRTGNNARRR